LLFHKAQGEMKMKFAERGGQLLSERELMADLGMISMIWKF
jgi:hypothetical protein